MTSLTLDECRERALSSPYMESTWFAFFCNRAFSPIGCYGTNVGFSKSRCGIEITVETRPQSLAERLGLCSSQSFRYSSKEQREFAFKAALDAFKHRSQIDGKDKR